MRHSTALATSESDTAADAGPTADHVHVVGKSGAKKVRAFGAVKRMIAPTDMRLCAPRRCRGPTQQPQLTVRPCCRKANQEKAVKKEAEKKEAEVRHVAPLPTSLFLSHNEALVPPYRVIVDTNFINLSLENRIDVVKGMSELLSRPKAERSTDLRLQWTRFTPSVSFRLI